LFVFDAAQGGKSKQDVFLLFSNFVELHMFHPSDFQSLEDRRSQKVRNWFWLGYIIGWASGAAVVVSWLWN